MHTHSHTHTQYMYTHAHTCTHTLTQVTVKNLQCVETLLEIIDHHGNILDSAWLLVMTAVQVYCSLQHLQYLCRHYLPLFFPAHRWSVWVETSGHWRVSAEWHHRELFTGGWGKCTGMISSFVCWVNVTPSWYRHLWVWTRGPKFLKSPISWPTSSSPLSKWMRIILCKHRSL